MCVCVRACVRVFVCVSDCKCACRHTCVRVACACSLALTHILTHTHACTLVTKAETTQLSPGLFDLLVSQFFSYMRRHHSLKPRGLVLLLD